MARERLLARANGETEPSCTQSAGTKRGRREDGRPWEKEGGFATHKFGVQTLTPGCRRRRGRQGEATWGAKKVKSRSLNFRDEGGKSDRREVGAVRESRDRDAMETGESAL